MSFVLSILAFLDSQDPESLYRSGVDKIEKEDFKGAVADLTRAVELDPRNGRAFERRGHARSELGEMEGAIADFSKAIEILPRETRSYRSRAWARSQRGDREGALADFTKAIEIDPDDVFAYRGRAQIRQEAKDVDGELADLDRAIKLRSRDPWVYTTRGWLLHGKGRSGNALNDLYRGIALHPRDPFPFFFRGMVRKSLEDWDEAIEDFSMAVAVDPKMDVGYVGRGLARRERGDRVGAIEDFTKAIELDPKSAEYHFYRGCVSYDVGDFKSALADFRESQTLGAEFQDHAAFRRWVCRAQLGERPQATTELRDFLSTRKSQGPGDWEGKIGAFLSGLLSEKELHETAKSKGQRGQAAFYAGTVKQLEGDRDSARTCFAKCLEMGRTNFLEYGTAVAHLEAHAPGDIRPAVIPNRVTIEIDPIPGACAAYGLETVCRDPEHWRFRVDGTEVLGKERFYSVIRKEADKEPSGLLGVSSRRSLVWMRGKAPFSCVMEALSACARGGMDGIRFRGESRPSKPGPKVPSPVVWKPADVDDVRLSIQWVDGALKSRVNQGNWVSDDMDLLKAFVATGKPPSHPVLIDPAPDVPCSEALRILDLCRGWELEAEFQRPFSSDTGPRTWGNVTAEEAVEFARLLEESLAAGNPTPFDEALARQEMLRRIFGANRLSTPLQCLVDSLLRDSALSGKRLKKDGEGARPLKFLRIHTVGGAPRPFFRMLTAENYDYLELELGKGRDGSILILDVHSLEMDGAQSRFWRGLWIPRPEDLDLLNSLRIPTPSDLLASHEEYYRLSDLAINRKYSEALEFFEKSSKAMRTDRVAHRVQLRAAMHVGPEAYEKAVRDLERDLPGDSSLLLFRIGAFRLTHQHEKALAALDTLERRVGDGPFLLVLRSNIRFSDQQYREAKELAVKATEQEPTLDRAWWALLNAGVPDKDYAVSVRALDRLERVLKIKVPDLAQTPGFEGFIKSREYQQWLKSRP